MERENLEREAAQQQSSLANVESITMISSDTPVTEKEPRFHQRSSAFLCYGETSEEMCGSSIQMTACFGAVGCGYSLPLCLIGDTCSIGRYNFCLVGSSLCIGCPFFASTFCCCVFASPRRDEKACFPHSHAVRLSTALSL